MWGEVSNLRKQHNGTDWALNQRANHYTTTPPQLGHVQS